MITLADLTPRERECAELMALGYRSATIARLMGVQPKTIETYHSNIIAKLYPAGIAKCWHPRVMIVRWYWNQCEEIK